MWRRAERITSIAERGRLHNDEFDIIRTIAGRDIEPADESATVRVAVGNEGFAALHFAGRSPVDRFIRVGTDSGRLVQIVGMRETTRRSELFY